MYKKTQNTKIASINLIRLLIFWRKGPKLVKLKTKMSFKSLLIDFEKNSYKKILTKSLKY